MKRLSDALAGAQLPIVPDAMLRRGRRVFKAAGVRLRASGGP